MIFLKESRDSILVVIYIYKILFVFYRTLSIQLSIMYVEN